MVTKSRSRAGSVACKKKIQTRVTYWSVNLKAGIANSHINLALKQEVACLEFDVSFVLRFHSLNPQDTVVSACRPTTCWTFTPLPVPKVSHVSQNKHIFIITPIFVVSTSSCWGSTEFLRWVAGLRIPDVSKKRNDFSLKDEINTVLFFRNIGNFATRR